MSGHCCHFTLNELQPCKLYLTTLGGYLFIFTHARSQICCQLLVASLPFFLPFQSSLAPFFKNISTHSSRINSILSKFSNTSQVSKVTKISPTTISLCRGPSRSPFGPFCPEIIEQCFFSRIPATVTFFHLLKVLIFRSAILLANFDYKNSVCFRLFGPLPLAPPNIDELLLF